MTQRLIHLGFQTPSTPITAPNMRLEICPRPYCPALTKNFQPRKRANASASLRNWVEPYSAGSLLILAPVSARSKRDRQRLDLIL
jgi:hypothetical protein